MLDRAYLESQPHWQATFEYVRRPGRFVCLMRTITGGFYWHEADYDGLFAAGATRPFIDADDLDPEYKRLVAGTMPEVKGGRPCPSR